MLSIHTEFYPIWSSRRDAVVSTDLEIINGIYCTYFILMLFIYTLEIELPLLYFSKIIARTGRDVGSCGPCHRVILRPNALVPEIIIYIGDLKTIVSRTNVFSCKITL